MGWFQKQVVHQLTSDYRRPLQKLYYEYGNAQFQVKYNALRQITDEFDLIWSLAFLLSIKKFFSFYISYNDFARPLNLYLFLSLQVELLQ